MDEKLNLNPNEYQQIFIVSFSVLYGVMLQNTMGLGLYHFAEEKTGRTIAYLRILLAFIFVNLGPFTTFAVIYTRLSTIINPINAYRILGLFIISLNVFLWFRILHIILFVWRDTLYPYWIYNNTRDKYNSVTKRLDDMGSWFWGHIIALAFYLGVIFLGWSLIFSSITI